MLSAFYAFHSSLEILVLCGKWYSMCSPFLCIAYYCLISISLIKFWIFSLNYITATHFKYPENCNMLKLLLFHVLCLWLPIYVNFLYCRNIQFFGMDSQKKVTESYVVVIGLGGVGSHAASMLLRSGVGRLLLVDFDQVWIWVFQRWMHDVVMKSWMHFGYVWLSSWIKKIWLNIIYGLKPNILFS